jgi:DNA-binding protein Fis
VNEQAHAPLSELVRVWFRRLLGMLGEHQVQGLYYLILNQVERVLIEEALLCSKGQLGRAARLLSLHRNSLRQRMRALGLSGKRTGRKQR